MAAQFDLVYSKSPHIFDKPVSITHRHPTRPVATL
jgi:hypothetical protein